MYRIKKAVNPKMFVTIAALALAGLTSGAVQAQISLDPTIDPTDPGQNPAYTQDGTGGTATSDGTRITLNRTNPAEKLVFFREAPSAGGAVTVEIDVQLTSSVANGDTGFHFIINPGSGQEVRVGLFAETGQPPKAGILGNGFAVVQSLNFDWRAGGTFRMERTAAGGAILHVGASSTSEVPAFNLGPSSRPGVPTFEFGFYSANQVGTASLGAITEVAGPCVFDPRNPSNFLPDPTNDPNIGVTPGTELRVADVTGGQAIFICANAGTIGTGFELPFEFGAASANLLPKDLGGGIKDSGVRVGFTDGNVSCVAALIIVNNTKKIAIVKGTGFSAGIVANWTGGLISGSLRKTATGVDLIIGGSTESVTSLPPSLRSSATIEYGCYSPAGQAIGIFKVIGAVVVSEPDIEVAPTALDFGSVNAFTSLNLIVTVANTGTLDLSVSEISLSGDPAFSAAPLLSPLDPPLVIAAGSSIDVTVTFFPTSAVALLGGTLTVVSDDPDEPVVVVSLIGNGLEGAVGDQSTVLEDAVNAGIISGGLVGSGPGNSADGRLEAFANMVEAAGDLISAGYIGDACGQLRSALRRVDGNPRPPDFVTGPDAALIRDEIEFLLMSLGCG